MFVLRVSVRPNTARAMGTIQKGHTQLKVLTDGNREMVSSTVGAAIDSASSIMLTIGEAAGILRCSKAHLCNVLNGRVSTLPPLPHVLLGRRKLIRRVALEQWLERLEVSPERR
jgi:hypothetical protein